MSEFHSVVECFEDLHACLAQFRDGRWVFRGHSSVDWTLVPKAGRAPFAGVDEVAVLESWKRRAVELVDAPPTSNWDWLAIAQHHGLATRLLDWSSNPLAAAYFAAHGSPESDACLYAYSPKWHVAREKVEPFDFKTVALFLPSAVVSRIARQSGLFTIHGTPTQALEDLDDTFGALHKILIPATYRTQLATDLDYYGISRASLFPDLDGLSDYFNWYVATKRSVPATSEDVDGAG